MCTCGNISLRKTGLTTISLLLTPATGDNTADTTAPPAAGRGKGKSPGNTLPQDRPVNNKYSRTDDPPIQGSNSVEYTGKGKGKWSNLAQEYVYFEPKGKGKGKGKDYATGHRYNGNTSGPIGAGTPSNVRSLTTSPITFFT